MRLTWLLVLVYPWLIAASYLSKQTIHQTRKYSSKEHFMRRLLNNVSGKEEILLKRIGAAVAIALEESKGGRETALVREGVASKTKISNAIVKNDVRGVRIRRQVDQEDIRRVLCRAATVGEFFRWLLQHMILSVLFLHSTAAFFLLG